MPGNIETIRGRATDGQTHRIKIALLHLYAPGAARILAAHQAIVVSKENEIRVLGTDDERVEVRVYAARSLERLGPVAKGAAKQLEAALKDESPIVREAARKALGKVAPPK